MRRPKLTQLMLCEFVLERFGNHSGVEKEKLEHEWSMNARSECLSCHNELKWYHNVPLLSYLALRGRCGYCGSSISLQYPTVELLTALMCTAAFSQLFAMTFSTQMVVYTLLVCVSVVICVIDLKSTEIFDVHNVVFVMLSMLLIGVSGEVDLDAAMINGFVGLFGFLLFLKVFMKVREFITGESIDVMGTGDLPLILVAVMWGVGMDVIEDSTGLLILIGLVLSVFVLTMLVRFLLVGKLDKEVPAAPAIIAGAHYLIWYQLM